MCLEFREEVNGVSEINLMKKFQKIETTTTKKKHMPWSLKTVSVTTVVAQVGYY